MMFQDVVIVIPAYEPDDRLLELLTMLVICKDTLIIKEKVVL